MQSFVDLGLAEPLARAVRDAKYTTPTPIQAQAIPPLLAGHDLLGIAQTGTGKTAAFALPILDKIIRAKSPAKPGHVTALVLAPTRELAGQIAESFRVYGRYAGVRVGCVFGGVSPGPQIQLLARGVDVLVATPGRLLDHLSAGKVSLGQTTTVVLDEADHMLDLGFIVPIRRIIAKLPRERQNLFLSATMPREIAGLADEFLRNPVRVSVTPPAKTVERVSQSAMMVNGGAKLDALVALLGDNTVSRAIVFTRTKHGADKVARRLETSAIEALAIHGNKSQNQRQRALDGFKAGAVRVLVATDIAARGIDVDNVSHVVNFDLPDVPEAYVHRIGRTARAGADGIAVSLVDPSEMHLLRAIEKATRQSVPIEDRRASFAGSPAAPTDTRDRGAPNRSRPQGETRKPAANAGWRRRERPAGEGRGAAPPAKQVWSNNPGASRPNGNRRNQNRSTGR